MVVHALVPDGNLFPYCEKLQRTFLSWLPPYNKTLCPKLSLQDILDCELDRGSFYFIITVEFTGPDPSDVDYTERSSTELTFSFQIQSYNATVPVRRPNPASTDFQDPFIWETTRTPHMDDPIRRELGLPPRHWPSAMLTAPEQGPPSGSYLVDEPSVLRAAIDAYVSDPNQHHTLGQLGGLQIYTCACFIMDTLRVRIAS